MSEEKKLGFWQRFFGGSPRLAPAPGCCCCAPAMERAVADAARQVSAEKPSSKDDSCCSDGKGSRDCCCG